MNKVISCRQFVKTGSAGGLAFALASPPGNLLANTVANANAEGVCLTLCNHWSYTGIGWQLGIESCVLSANDAMGMADLAPHVKTCLEMDARAYELIAEKFPEVAARLKKYLAEDRIELIGGTYAQPLGTMFSGESNIRQLVVGRETIRKALNYEVTTFLDEEEFSHPQVPQIAVGAGFKYASLSQLDTWGKAGIPDMEVNAFRWKGMDGTTILSTPKNSLFGSSANLIKRADSETLAKLRLLGKPLLFTWEEFGWESAEQPSYLASSKLHEQVAGKLPVEFVTLKDYLDRYGSSAASEPVYLRMDAWDKLLTWGLGGDQLRIMDRKVEGTLLAAERFDAIAASLGGKDNLRALDNAWKNLLISQSHDVGLCEYSRWAADRLPPLDRMDDKHNLTWGAMGYNHLDAAEQMGQEVLSTSLDVIAARINSRSARSGDLAIAVFNPSAWQRTDIVTTGRLYPIRSNTQEFTVRDAKGRALPSQIIKSELDASGNLIAADLAFLASDVPSVGYDTYLLEPRPGPAPPPPTDLRIDEQQLMMENAFVRVKLSAKFGAMVSLFDKRTGREALDGQKGAFPVFKGIPNQDYELYKGKAGAHSDRPGSQIPAEFDTSKSDLVYVQSDAAGAPIGTAPHVETSWIRWIEKGPLRATLKARHAARLLTFESYITLCAGLPFVEVATRVVARIPPARDSREPDFRFPSDIKNGYWLTFAPAFQPSSVIRDFPLGIERTEGRYFQGRTFIDLVADGSGLLILHPGTQYFKRDAEGIFSNLIMREWESHYSREYGWPRYCEYHHILAPHHGALTNADRVRAAEAMSQKLMSVVGKPGAGSLPARKSFVQVNTQNLQLMTLRKKAATELEIRTVDVEGKEAPASISIELPARTGVETNLLGKKIADVSFRAGQLRFQSKPWKVQTFEVK